MLQLISVDSGHFTQSCQDAGMYSDPWGHCCMSRLRGCASEKPLFGQQCPLNTEKLTKRDDGQKAS